MNAYANGVCGRGEHPGARARRHNPQRRFAAVELSLVLSARSASARVASALAALCVFNLVQGCVGCAPLLWKLVGIASCTSYYMPSVGCGWLTGWLVPRHFCTCGRPAPDTRVYKFLHYDLPVFICPNTRTPYLYMLLYSDAHKLRAAVHTNSRNSQTHHSKTTMAKASILNLFSNHVFSSAMQLSERKSANSIMQITN